MLTRYHLSLSSSLAANLLKKFLAAMAVRRNTHLFKQGCAYSDTIRDQFHQLFGAKHNCASRQSFFRNILFHQQIMTKRYKYLYTQLENMLNLYTVCSAVYANKFSINLLAQKLPVEHWWNFKEHLLLKLSISMVMKFTPGWVILISHITFATISIFQSKQYRYF